MGSGRLQGVRVPSWTGPATRNAQTVYADDLSTGPSDSVLAEGALWSDLTRINRCDARVPPEVVDVECEDL